MPIYEMRCQGTEAHEFPRFCGVAVSEEGVPCPECGANAEKFIAGKMRKLELVTGFSTTSRHSRGPGLHDAESGRRYWIRDRMCHNEACGHIDETIESWVDEEDKLKACSKCGGPARDQAIAPLHYAIDRFSEVFPVFDLGLGIWLTSKNHRREEMKKRGIEGSYDCDIEDTIARHVRKLDDDERKCSLEYNRTLDMYKHHPDFRKVYGELEEQGKGGTPAIIR